MSTHTSPHDPQLLYRQALGLHQNGRPAEAEQGLRHLLARHPDHVEALFSLGNVLIDLRRNDEALANFERAVRLRPDVPEIWITRGNALRNLRRHQDALASYNQGLALRANFPQGLCARASLLQEGFKRVDDALADYDRALALAPDYVEVWYNRGNALLQMNRYDAAIASYDRALALRPGMVEALKNRGQAFFQSGRIEEGIAAFGQAANFLYGGGGNPYGGATPPQLARHAQEQQEYRRTLAGPLWQNPGARLAGPTLSSLNRTPDPEETWRTSKPQIVVLDDFLTPEALTQLRRFCLEEPVWRMPYPGGYLGAFPEHGFACPLLGQIAGELRQRFPAILKDHALSYLWGFKYDSQRQGISIHADSAAVNVNFWITPDEANLDPASGGLVIWDVAAPSDWDDDMYNRPDQAGVIRGFLAAHGAKPTTVPYRSNRAVIFDSDLFHETDTIRFKDGYADRRINVTMLYGRRHPAGAG